MLLNVLLLALLGSMADGEADALTRQLLPSTIPAPAGGRCLDGTMAGYYLHKGTDPDLFVIYLKGGGACYDETSCTTRAKSALGSSSYWDATMVAKGAYSSDCVANPDFCAATHVFVPYCTGDCHAGNNTAPSDSAWGLFFDGHANFAAIVAELQEQHGLAAAKKVLLTGGSAGGIGTFKNVDFLQAAARCGGQGRPRGGLVFPCRASRRSAEHLRAVGLGAFRQRNAWQPLVGEQLASCICSRRTVAVARPLSTCMCGAAKARRVVGLWLD
jgi:O-palmitoleoyl-L-serine hydrolase